MKVRPYRDSTTFEVEIVKPKLVVTFFSSLDVAAEYAVNGSKRPSAYIAMNAEKMVKLWREPGLFAGVQNPLYYPDGTSMLLFTKRKSPRLPGVELWLKVLERFSTNGGIAVIIGARKEVSQIAKQQLKSMFPSIEFLCIDGFQRPEVYTDLVTGLKPDMVFVAMGSPRQEMLIAQLQRHSTEAFYMGIGGSLDILSGKTKRAPRIFRAMHVEFLYRLLREPRRIFRQRALFKFLYLVFTGNLRVERK